MNEIVDRIINRDPGEKEFHQAVGEVLESVRPVLERNPEYRRQRVFERLAEPERVVMFRVPWQDDRGEIQINRGFRVQMSSAIGPYKGGLRFHPSVTISIMKFLAFEQVFKNALTTLPMGGGKGGSDFDPKGKSDNEVMRFCQSFMQELFRHIGHDTDVPAGDIGVGAREIGYLFGTYKRLSNRFSGILTGKGLNWGGSLIRPEATGYGCVYFAAEMLATRHQNLEGGIDRDKLDFVMFLKNVRRGRIAEYAEKYEGVVYTPVDPTLDHNPLWDHPADGALPCATQNEINARDAENLIKNKVSLVCEGANMPTTPEGITLFLDSGILYAPGKAANAGGVAVSGLEMAQNSMRLGWPRQEVEDRLRAIMKSIHRACLAAAEEYGTPGNYMNGANIAGFVKVVEAMLDQGLV
ncbi:MAG: glutamate dehydrogenase [Desulfobacterales bacterium]|nr:glutamate dehydrogenase [Desulfobacterales bacterium]